MDAGLRLQHLNQGALRPAAARQSRVKRRVGRGDRPQTGAAQLASTPYEVVGEVRQSAVYVSWRGHGAGSNLN